jgi:ABC-type microcin C transport system permease subunit YejB
MRGECPVCLKVIDVPANSEYVVCPVCSTQLKVSKPLYQEIAVVKLYVWDFVLPLLPAVLAGWATHSTIGPHTVEVRRERGVTIREKKLDLVKMQRDATIRSAFMSYVGSFLALQGIKIAIARGAAGV